MAKLVVEEFARLSNVNSTRFYRLFGSVLEYDHLKGVIKLASLFDGSICEIELDLEIETYDDNEEIKLRRGKEQRTNFHEGFVVDVNTVTVSIDNRCKLMANHINIVNLPGPLVESKEILREFAQIQ